MKGGGGGAGLVHRVLASEAKAEARPKQTGKQNPQTRTCGRTGKKRGQETRRLQQMGSRCCLKTRACFSVSVRAQSKTLPVLYDGIALLQRLEQKVGIVFLSWRKGFLLTTKPNGLLGEGCVCVFSMRR